MSRPTQVIVAAPYPLMLAGLRSLIESERDLAVLAACSSYLLTLRALKRHRPPVLVADALLCDPHDPEALERLRSASPGTRVALIGSAVASRFSLRASDDGATILPPDVSAEKLLRCVRTLAADRPRAAPIVRRGRGAAVGISPGVRSPLALLTIRERQIAQGVARGKRNREIAEACGITPGTVKLHLHKIYSKLGVNSRLALFKKLAEEAQ